MNGASIIKASSLFELPPQAAGGDPEHKSRNQTLFHSPDSWSLPFPEEVKGPRSIRPTALKPQMVYFNEQHFIPLGA